MITINKQPKGEKIWYIVNSFDYTVIHYGIVDDKTSMQSGQDEVEEFTNESEWRNRLIELGIDELDIIDDDDDIFEYELGI